MPKQVHEVTGLATDMSALRSDLCGHAVSFLPYVQ